MNLASLAMAATLAALLPNAQRRSDRLALGACIGCLLVAFAVTNLVPAPHRLVLGTSVAALLVCLGTFVVVAYTRFRDRRRAT